MVSYGSVLTYLLGVLIADDPWVTIGSLLLFYPTYYEVLVERLRKPK